MNLPADAFIFNSSNASRSDWGGFFVFAGEGSGPPQTPTRAKKTEGDRGLRRGAAKDGRRLCG